MNIRHRRAIHETAAAALNQAEHARQIALIYGLICCGLSLLSTVLSVLLGDRISGAGGLSNIGLRSVLSTGQSVLPLVTLIVTACLSLGYHIAMLSYTRGFDASTHTLVSGFRHFGPVIRAMLTQGFVYLLVGFAAVYISSSIFMATPFADPFIELMEPAMESITTLDTTIQMDEALLMAAAEALIPMLWIFLAVFLVMALPIHYRFRMINFCLADDPQNGAVFALTKSRFLMRRKCFSLFRLDLTLWWFYAAQLLISMVCYGDILLPMVGITFPWNSDISYYLFLILSLLMQLALYYFGMNRVYAVYAVAYDVLQEESPLPEPPVQQ